jgi:integrase
MKGLKMKRKLKAWVKRKTADVKKFGPDVAPWCAEWLEPDGVRVLKTFGPGERGKAAAEAHAEAVDSDLRNGRYISKRELKAKEQSRRTRWCDFRKRYDQDVVAEMRSKRSQESIQQSLKKFEKLVAPDRLDQIDVGTIESFVRLRLKERGRKRGTTVSRASVNHDLRNLRAALRTAARWKMIVEAPAIRIPKDKKRRPRYMRVEHFGAIFKGCDAARWPNAVGHPCYVPAPTWWRGLLAALWMTGWRISEVLALRTENVRFDEKTLYLPPMATKNKTEVLMPLQDDLAKWLMPVVGDRVVRGLAFYWDRNRRQLDTQFHAIQKAAGVEIECRVMKEQQHPEHECTDACKRYSFHAIRKAFVTYNRRVVTPEVMQQLARHESYETTREYYLNVDDDIAEAVERLNVPDCLRPETA